MLRHSLERASAFAAPAFLFGGLLAFLGLSRSVAHADPSLESAAFLCAKMYVTRVDVRAALLVLWVYVRSRILHSDYLCTLCACVFSLCFSRCTLRLFLLVLWVSVRLQFQTTLSEIGKRVASLYESDQTKLISFDRRIFAIFWSLTFL